MKTFYILLLTLVSQLALAQTTFVTRWNLATAGSGATQLTFGVETSGTVSYTWQEVSPGTGSGTGTFSGSTATITALPSGAVIDLNISPTNFNRFNINNGTDKNRLTNVRQWGTTTWTSMQEAFSGCSNLQISATDVPNLSGVTRMGAMFRGCTILNGPANIGSWNTENVYDMSQLFRDANAFNQPIATWNTAEVISMAEMFRGANTFNQPIGTWNTAKVTNMNAMFSHANSFNQPIGTWDTGNVINLGSMFSGAKAFNQPIGNWNTAKVTFMGGVFSEASAFDKPIGNWNTANVTSMASMFAEASAFNQPIGNWNTSKVTVMVRLFSGARAFNQPLSSWNVASVSNMSFMFAGATAFNQPIGNWDTANVTNMSRMFYDASAFDRPIGNWNTALVTDMSYIFSDAALFNQPIGNWNTASVTDMSGMFFKASSFNQPIGNWQTANVTNMTSLFANAHDFNQPIDTWNTVSVTNMSAMFSRAIAFNQPIGNWNTANVTNMSFMFSNASAFNQSLGNWTLNSSVNLAAMLQDCGVNCEYYSATLIGWSANPSTPNGRSLGAGGRSYGIKAVAARNNLTTTKGWNINADVASGTDCSAALPVTLSSFSGKKTTENQNTLKWITADEKDFDRFEVQRSGDAKGFETIGRVLGQGAWGMGVAAEPGQILNTYTFTDPMPGASNYYRLKMVNRDGSFEFSRIISIANSSEQAVVGSFYPNPSNGKVFVDVYALESGSWTLTITDAAGKMTGTQLHDLQKGMNKINLNRLSPGLNLVRFEHGRFFEVRKLVSE